MVDQPRDRDTPQGTGTLGGKREPPAYYAYLLRLWRVTEMGQPAAWRGSLQAARNGEILGFASLDELFKFLRRLTGMTSDTAEGEDEARA
jgi:hypothetical protein